MNEQVLLRAKAFEELNDLALKGEIVVFGSTYMAQFPFYELINRSCLETAVYNRSIPHMTLPEALELLPDCVLALEPEKVFLHLGEEDFDQPEAVETYLRIVDQIRAALPETKIYLIALQNPKAQRFNAAVARCADRKHVECIRLVEEPSAYDFRHQFKELCSFFRDHPITSAEAFAVAGL